jgi:hypothetical protein
MKYFNMFLAGALFTVMVAELGAKQYRRALISAALVAFNIYAATL